MRVAERGAHPCAVSCSPCTVLLFRRARAWVVACHMEERQRIDKTQTIQILHHTHANMHAQRR